MAEKWKVNELTYDDFLDRLSIQEVLMDAGYHLNKRDGLRYPSYVRTIESTSKCKFVAKLGKMFEKDLIWGKEI